MLSKAERQRRRKAYRVQFREEFKTKCVRPGLVSGAVVEIFFAGVPVFYRFEQGEAQMLDNGGVPLEPQDAVVLKRLAQDMRENRIRSYRSDRPRHRKKNQRTIEPTSVRVTRRNPELVRRARQSELYQMYAADTTFPYIAMRAFDHQSCKLRIGNFEYVFRLENDYARMERHSVGLGDQQYEFACEFTRRLMKAAWEAYRRSQYPKQRPAESGLQYNLPFYGPGPS